MRKNLPTRTELKEQLEERCDMYKKDVGSAVIVENNNERYMYIELTDSNLHEAATTRHYYTPDLKIPEDGCPVLGYNDETDCITLDSSMGTVGYFDELECYQTDYKLWYNIITGEHHPDFPIEKIPQEILAIASLQQK